MPERVIGVPMAYGPELAWIEIVPSRDEDADVVVDEVVVDEVVVDVVVVVVCVGGRKSIPLNLVF